MSDQRNQVIKGSPSQYVKLNIGGKVCIQKARSHRKVSSTFRSYFRFPLLHHNQNANKGRLYASSDVLGQVGSPHRRGRLDPARQVGKSTTMISPNSSFVIHFRCGKHFGTILNFLRDGTTPLPDTAKGLAELLAEAQYYCIEELAESCERALDSKKKELTPICKVPLITSATEENYLISTSTKPVVKLLINRHNNKYSYTNTSDDNLLKNIELFDKLSLRFSGRILFIKDVIGSSEIACWVFYGNGKKIAEVCCTSIVYSTDRKHTKVEFPEARIYEETLHTLLYENRNNPDQELMQATSTTRSGISYTSDEEDTERSGGPLARLRSNKQNNPT